MCLQSVGETSVDTENEYILLYAVTPCATWSKVKPQLNNKLILQTGEARYCSHGCLNIQHGFGPWAGRNLDCVPHAVFSNSTNLACVCHAPCRALSHMSDLQTGTPTDDWTYGVSDVSVMTADLNNINYLHCTLLDKLVHTLKTQQKVGLVI